MFRFDISRFHKFMSQTGYGTVELRNQRCAAIYVPLKGRRFELSPHGNGIIGCTYGGGLAYCLLTSFPILPAVALPLGKRPVSEQPHTATA